PDPERLVFLLTAPPCPEPLPSSFPLGFFSSLATVLLSLLSLLVGDYGDKTPQRHRYSDNKESQRRSAVVLGLPSSEFFPIRKDRDPSATTPLPIGDDGTISLLLGDGGDISPSKCCISLSPMVLLYIHGLAARGVHYLHRPGPILQDVGFAVLPELGKERRYISESVFTFVFCSFVLIAYPSLDFSLEMYSHTGLNFNGATYGHFNLYNRSP
ncbi:hypothetical protein Taro_016596, partial [Colocasia esculenta]|nr:hypothetical protein [Colocasia esculenta]